MPNKLTDKEIVKALECCINGNCITKNCPLQSTEDISSKCEAKLMELTIDLINLQKAEISVKNKLLDIAEAKFETIKAKAYKEFAERLKLHAYHECDITGYRYLVVQIEEIDTLLKEMESENDA